MKNKPLDLNKVSCYMYNEATNTLTLLAEGTNYNFTGDKAKEIHNLLLSMENLNEQKSNKQILKG